MRTIMVTIAAAMMALNVAAYNPGVGPDNYCVKNKNGKTIVELNGTTITKEIKFKDGTLIKPNGTVILTSGETVKLKEGECVNETSVMSLSKRRPSSIGEQKDWEEKIPMDKEEYPEMKTDSTKSDEALDPDRYKNDQSNPGKKWPEDKDSDEELPPKK
jgi:hypothetical protein